jgi:hypothetical protein
MGLAFMADGCTDAPAGVDPPASLPLPSSNSHPALHPSFQVCPDPGACYWAHATPYAGFLYGV